jgi:hypothetical protein
VLNKGPTAELYLYLLLYIKLGSKLAAPLCILFDHMAVFTGMTPVKMKEY